MVATLSRSYGEGRTVSHTIYSVFSNRTNLGQNYHQGGTTIIKNRHFSKSCYCYHCCIFIKLIFKILNICSIYMSCVYSYNLQVLMYNKMFINTLFCFLRLFPHSQFYVI